MYHNNNMEVTVGIQHLEIGISIRAQNQQKLEVSLIQIIWDIENSHQDHPGEYLSHWECSHGSSLAPMLGSGDFGLCATNLCKNWA